MTGSSLARRIALVGLVALVASLVTATAAFAQDPTPDQDTYVDLDADDNPDYSVRWSQFTFESADEVLIGRDDLFPDNLASGSLQGQGGGRPLLLTPSDALDERVANEIGRLGASTAHILGGEFAIGPDVADALEDLGLEVQRHGGETRIETAIEISELVDSDTVIIARAFANEDPTQAFADSLAAGAWAADAGYDLLLTQTEVLTENTQTAIEAAGYSTAFVVGGESAISGETFDAVAALVADTQRVGGANRFETAVLIANERGFASADDAAVTVLTDGQGADAWADGFSAAAFTALHDAPLVLSNSASDSLPAETVAFLEGGGAASFAQDATANELDPDVGLVCGPSVPDGDDPDTVDDQCDEAAALRGLTNRVEFGDPTVEPPPPDNNQTLSVEPTDEATLTVDEERQYTAQADEDCEGDYTIALFDTGDVTVDEDGNVTFNDEPDNGTADNIGGTGPAFLSVVNGSATAGNPGVVTAEPQAGALTFTVASTGEDSVVPVVFCDADSDGQLDLQDEPAEGEEGLEDAPTAEEFFGIGGQVDFIPAEVADGTFAAGVVTTVDDDHEYAVLGGAASVFFREGDVYRIFGAGGLYVIETAEEFFVNLSVDDILFTCSDDTGTAAAYDQDGPNSYCLFDQAPANPTNLTAADGNPTDTNVDLTWTASTTTTVDSYNIYANDEACAATTVAELGLIGNVEATETEFTAMGLEPSTTYCFVVTSVDDEDEGTLAVGSATPANDNTVEWATSAPVEAPIIEVATLDTDAPIEGIVDTGDVWELEYNEPMNPLTVAGAQINITDVDGDTARLECGLAAGAADFLTDATCVLDVTNTILTVTVDETAEDRNAAGDDDIEYGVTITSITVLEDVDDGAETDIAASDDVAIP